MAKHKYLDENKQEAALEKVATVDAEAGYAFGPIYDNGTYKYFGDAKAGTSLSTAAWRISRMTIATSQIQWCDGDNNFDNVFTDLATVAALSYS